MIEHLSQAGVPHIVVERIGSPNAGAWKRWDSLVANGPALARSLSGPRIFRCRPNVGRDDFAPKNSGGLFRRLCQEDLGPIRCGVDVLKVERRIGRPGFRSTLRRRDRGQQRRRGNRLLSASRCSRVWSPASPSGATALPQGTAIRPSCSEGAILVVDLVPQGPRSRKKLLRVRAARLPLDRPHDRPPRAYRGSRLLLVARCSGKWDAVAREPGREHV